MSMVDDSPNQEYLDAIKRLRLIDYAFFNVCMDDNIKCMQLILQILHRPKCNALREISRHSRFL